MSANLQNPIFTDETKAREWLETRIWPNGPTCPHCGNANQKRLTSMHGKVHRAGLYQCNEPECREQFTVTVGTIFERSKIPLTKWVAALFLLSSSKKGMSSHQIHRMLGISYKSTWFMMHRLREAMRAGDPPPMGGSGSVVEVDETFIGRQEGQPMRHAGWGHKNAVMTLVERGGSARSFHVESTRRADVEGIMRANIHKESRLMTDEARHYTAIGKEFASHESVRHGEDEYVRGDVHTNTVENFYSVFKRGMKGVYQHCGERHLHRYVGEFDFRYSNRAALGVDDMAHAEKLAKGIVGKRLTYRRPYKVSETASF
ncbi:MAG: IS1595 family transposase [Methylocella sp.]